jgi:hypothetical protein
VTLPALELHEALDRLAVHDAALHAQPRPHHPIAQIRLIVDETFDALRQDLVDNRHALTVPVVRRAARHVQESTDSLTRSLAVGDHTLDVWSPERKGRIAS